MLENSGQKIIPVTHPWDDFFLLDYNEFCLCI